MNLAFDPGYGSVKLYGPNGGLVMPSLVALAGAKAVKPMAGLRVTKPPLRVELEHGAFYVGEGAHEWGRPVENLDFERLTGSPEMLALLCGALTKYGAPEADLIVGLPLASLADGNLPQAVAGFLKGNHQWTADGQFCRLVVNSVLTTSQPVGAMFDYLLSDRGEMPLDRVPVFKGEIGVFSIGMNTVELLVVTAGKPVNRFIGGETLGVRRLLELLNGNGLYSLGELDAKLRRGQLEVGSVLPVWKSEVLGFVERQWSDSFRRFGQIVAVGGGVYLLKDELLKRFRDKLFIPDDPVISTARGLYKYLLRRKNGSSKAKEQTASRPGEAEAV